MTKMLALAAAAALAALPLLPDRAQAVPPRQGQDLIEWCLLSGGEVIDQPPGSSIAACCTEDGCIICAADWSDCTFDPSYRSQVGLPELGEAADTLAPPSRGSSGPDLPDLDVLDTPLQRAN